MRYYLLSKNKCAVKYNGRFIGICSNNVSAIETKENSFLLEFIPESPLYFPIAFYACDVSATIRQDMAIMALYGGFLLIPSFSKKPYSRFETLFRKDFDGENTAARVTLLRDGSDKILVETKSDAMFASADFRDGRNDTHGAAADLYGNTLIVRIKDKTEKIYAFSLDGKIAQLNKVPVECDYSAVSGGILTTVKKLKTLTAIKKTETYSADGFIKKSCKFTRNRPINAINRNLLPYAFLEEVKCGGDYGDYLTDKLAAHKDLIPEFFGSFAFFLPPPCADCPEGIVLISDVAKTVVFEQKGCLIDNFYFL